MVNSKTMKYSLLFILFFLLVFSSCSKEYIIERKEDKIIGAWEIDKVFYKKDWALFRDDITHQFRHDIVEFFPNYEAIYDDYSLNAVFDGSWSLIVDEEYCCGEDCFPKFLLYQPALL